ncbi:MlaA family lipoprotein [Kordiimonas lacus]|uniref:Phospholipid-binding lipoprotein MlaA n=1 Tax=Kordiimonas lacus TaxID=637679 RepID=A0A1G7B1B2_9PROT|nr:VacJ family lipoprotein [Kordiimonas lacus]SDE20046.1 phospholipid-binding lipoprotein MlaA [Kordiimonas lacus]
MTARKFFTLGLLLLTAACASTSQNGPSASANDPLEPMNRAVFAFNKATDRAVLKPLSSAYIAVVPEEPRKGVSNVMRNLREPWVFVNDILQLKFGRAGKTLGRFVVNSTIGIGGLFKVSDRMGVEYHSEDFGQTLATWGVGDGPYIVLPFLGPSNLRDTVGTTAYFFYDPTTTALNKKGELFDLALLRTGIDAFDARVRYHEAIDELYKEDDPYVVARSLYHQTRRYEIHDGDPPPDEDEVDFFDDLEDELDTDEPQ